MSEINENKNMENPQENGGTNNEGGAQDIVIQESKGKKVVKTIVKVVVVVVTGVTGFFLGRASKGGSDEGSSDGADTEGPTED